MKSIKSVKSIVAALTLTLTLGLALPSLSAEYEPPVTGTPTNDGGSGTRT